MSHATSDVSRRSSGQSANTTSPAATVGVTPSPLGVGTEKPSAVSSSGYASSDLRRLALQRHQTFDSSLNTSANVPGNDVTSPASVSNEQKNAEDKNCLTNAGENAHPVTSDVPPVPSGPSNLTPSHSKRSHSCIAPVDISIRRLSGGVNLIEESSFDLESEKKSGQSAGSPNESTEKLIDSKGDHMNDDQTIGSPPSSSLVPVVSNQENSNLMGSAAAAAAAAYTCSSASSSTRSSFAVSRSEQKRREAFWDLFQSECVFLYDHLMVLKNVFMEPLKKIQVEGFAMFAEPEVLFGNLDELCCVTYAFCKEFVNVLLHQMNSYDINATDALVKLFQKSSKAASLTQAYHRYTLNYINALNYLETLRRQVEFNEFEKVSERRILFSRTPAVMSFFPHPSRASISFLCSSLIALFSSTTHNATLDFYSPSASRASCAALQWENTF